MPGKQDNCQVAVSISLATDQSSVPVAYRLYLPKAWAQDEPRRRKAGVPPEIAFTAKTRIAQAELETMLAQDALRHCVLADAGYGVDTAFGQRLTNLGLDYVVGVTSAVVVWRPGIEPLPPRQYPGSGRPPLMPRRTRRRQPISVKALALTLPASTLQTISWREDKNETLSSRFAAVRVRHAVENSGKARLRPEQWLPIEWPAGDAEPLKYFLSTLPAATPLSDLVAKAHLHRRIERDYQDLKQELGLDDYERREGRGFHHHASLTIAAYGFLVSDRIAAGARENFIERQMPAVRVDYLPRGSPARAAPSARLTRRAAPPTQLSPDCSPAPVPVLRPTKRKAPFLTP